MFLFGMTTELKICLLFKADVTFVSSLTISWQARLSFQVLRGQNTQEESQPRLLPDNQEASEERFIASLRPHLLWHNYVWQTEKLRGHKQIQCQPVGESEI